MRQFGQNIPDIFTEVIWMCDYVENPPSQFHDAKGMF
jgi:hypothetical protein